MEDMKLRQDTTLLINALGLNSTLTHLDIRSAALAALIIYLVDCALDCIFRSSHD